MKVFPILIVLLILLQVSCQNPFMDDSDAISFPDTAVQINSLAPQVCEVKDAQTDSSYLITTYWTDKLTGRIIYKMREEPYKFSRLHGTKYEFDDKGDTLIIAHFEDGVRVDSTVYKYPNGQVKQKFVYSKKRDGNILWEMNYHPNGRKRSDVIPYTNGLITGAVTYYDSSYQNKPTETYYYVESEIVGIKIYNDQYAELDRRKLAMLKAYQQDSARIAEALNDTTDNSFREIPVFMGSSKDAMYDIGEPDNLDIMKVDPNFILRWEEK